MMNKLGTNSICHPRIAALEFNFSHPQSLRPNWWTYFVKLGKTDNNQVMTLWDRRHLPHIQRDGVRGLCRVCHLITALNTCNTYMQIWRKILY